MDHKYIGTETRDGLTVTVHSTSDGKPVTSALELRLDLRNHSPDGFGCGYYGSGPAQLALAILAHQAGDEAALRLYQNFKSAVIARLPRDTTWTITGQQVADWLEREVVRAILAGIVAEGYVFSIFDGGEWVVREASDIEAGLAALFTSDGDIVHVRTKTGERVGSINLIYGNAPWEVVQDHTDNERIAACLADATALGNRLEAAAG